MIDAPIDTSILERESNIAWDANVRLLQPWRFAESDEAHVAYLLDAFYPPPAARILDVGCGFGETARLMADARPDLGLVMLNSVQSQLDRVPEKFERVLGDAHDLPFEDAAFDAVMFNASLCNMDVFVAMAEASRVLKPGGVLFLNELLRDADGDNERLAAWCGARAYTHEEMVSLAGVFGLELCLSGSPEPVHEYLRNMGDHGYDAAFTGIRPGIWRFVRGNMLPVSAGVGRVIGRHDRIALQVSGGKDSLALLYLLQPWWHRICVYWLNTGDAYPETVARMARVREEVPFFREIAGLQPAIVAADGWPSDVVPQRHTTDGNFVFGATEFKVQSRLSCCWRSLMLPMHRAMIDDGVTLVIRAKRADEADKTGVQSGYVENGIEMLFPIMDWTEADVFQYLCDNDIEIPVFYDYSPASLDCMSCTAWLEHKNGDYLAAKYPDKHAEHTRRLGLIKAAVIEQMEGM